MMKRVSIGAAVLVSSMCLVSQAFAGEDIAMVWTDVQSDYDDGLNLQWVDGYVHSPEADNEGSSVFYTIRGGTANQATGFSSITASEYFGVVVEDPLENDPYPSKAVLAFDQEGNWDVNFSIP